MKGLMEPSLLGMTQFDVQAIRPAGVVVREEITLHPNSQDTPWNRWRPSSPSTDDEGEDEGGEEEDEDMEEGGAWGGAEGADAWGWGGGGGDGENEGEVVWGQ